MAFVLGIAISNGESQTQQSPHALKSNGPQKSHDPAFESGFDIAILLLEPDAFLIEVQYLAHIVGMAGQITGGSQVGPDRSTEHLLSPPQPSNWHLHPL